jgi:transcriptional regulator with XRE-family HTH domain
MINEVIYKLTGDELKQLRKAANLEQKELAQMMAAEGWTRHTVANFERLKDRQFVLSQRAGELLLESLKTNPKQA